MHRFARRSALSLSSVVGVAALAVLATAAPASAETIPPTYYPNGPQVEVNQADLEGWTLCFSGVYGDDEIPLYGEGGILSELCTGDYLLLAGGPTDDPVLTVLAAAPRADVIFETGDNVDVSHNANGSEWYFNGANSWGFALGGDAVNKDSCDIDPEIPDQPETNPADRLCFHLSDNRANETDDPYYVMEGGFRAGENVFLNGSDAYTRYIYQADGTEVAAPAPAPQLAETGVDSTVPLFVAGGLLALGLAVMTVTAVRRRSSH